MTTYSTGNPIGSGDPRDLRDNAENLDVAVNADSEEEWTDRMGVQRKTWHSIEQQVNDIIIAGGQIFPDEATGRAAVDDGQYYYAVSSDPNVSRTLWKRVTSSTSEKIADDVDKPYIDRAFADISICFTNEIVYDNLAGQITFPEGIALQAGGGAILSFNEITLDAPASIPNGAKSGLEYYYYLDAAETVDHPIKFATGGGGAYPLQNGSLRKIGTLFKGNWSNSEFSFRTINEPRSQKTLLKNVIPNANKDPRTSDIIFYGDIRPTSMDNSPLVDAPQSLVSLGVEKCIHIEAGQPLRGNFLVYPFSCKTTTKPNIFMAVVVNSTNGTWDFESIGPYYYLAVTNTSGATHTVQEGELSVLREIDTNTRVYGISLYPDDAPEGAQFSQLTLGVRALPTTTDFYFGGFWTSIAAGVEDFLQGVGIDETFWPQWKQVDKPVADSAIAVEHPSGLKAITESLANPFHSMQVRLIGDSITWGTGATGNSPSTPRAQSLDDPRNNLTASSWANLLRDYLGTLFCGVLKARVDLGDGGSTDSHIVAIQPVNSSTRYVHPLTRIAFDPFKNDTYPDSFAHGYSIDIKVSTLNDYNYDCDIEIDLVGDNLTVVFSQLDSDTELSEVDVLVDGVYQESFTYAGPPTFNVKSPAIFFPFGAHTITLRRANTAPDSAIFRLEGFEVEQKVNFWNDGIIGTNTSKWMPPYGLVVDSIDAADEVVFVQLGTNNRAADGGLAQKQFKQQLVSIVEYLLELDKKVVLCASCVASVENESTPDVYAVHMNEIAATIKDVAESYGLDFIDQYAATLQPYIEGQAILDDGLHPNDVGYKLMFDNIKRRLISAGAGQ